MNWGKIIKILILIIIFGLILNGLTLLIAGKNIVDLAKYWIASVTQFILVIEPALCGNGIRQPGEECDGNDLGGQTCVSLGYVGGTLSCKADCTFDTSGCTIAPPPPPIVIAPPIPPLVPIKVVLEGWAYPSSWVTILKDGKVAKKVLANSQAEFKAKITDLTPGIYTFGIWAEDKGILPILCHFCISKLKMTFLV